MTELTITATELSRKLGEYLRLAEHGTTITVIDGKHPGWVRAIITPPSGGHRELLDGRPVPVLRDGSAG